MRLFFSIAALFFLTRGLGQSLKIDSLNKQLSTVHDTSRVDCLNAISDQYINEGTRDSADYYQQKALSEAQKLDYIHGIAEAIRNAAGITLFYDNDFKTTEKLCRESLQWYSKTGNKGKTWDYIDFYFMNALFWQSKFDEMLDLVNQRYEVAKATNRLLYMEGTTEAKSDVFYMKGNFDSAFYYLLEINRLSKGAPSYSFPFSVFAFRMGRLHRGIGDYQTALIDYRQTFLNDTKGSIEDRDMLIIDTRAKMEFAELFALNNQFDSAWYYYHLFDTTRAAEKDLRIYWVSTGETYLLQKKYQNALPNLKRGLVINQRLNDQTEVKRALLDMAKTYLETGDNKTAIAYAKEGLALSIQSKSRQFIRDAYYVFYSAFDKMGLKDSAFIYYKKYMEMKDIVVSDQTKGRYMAYNYDQKYKLLDAEKRLTEDQLKQASLQKILLIIGISIVMLCGLFIIRYYALKRKNEAGKRQIAETELQKQKIENMVTEAGFQSQKADLEMKILRAQMNPHFIFNSLNSINRFILQNNRQQASEYLTKFSRLVRMILQNSQSHLITLESELDALGLYLEMEALRFNFHFTYSVIYPNDLDITMIKVPPLVIQPYVENAIWHGLMHKEEPGHLVIEAEESEGYLFFTIRDDGIGRAQSAILTSKSATRHKSMGLKITSDRIAMMRKMEENESAITINDLVHADGSAAGTEVIIKIPVVI